MHPDVKGRKKGLLTHDARRRDKAVDKDPPAADRKAGRGGRLTPRIPLPRQPPRRDNAGRRDRGARRGGLAAPRHQRHRRARRLARRRQGDGEDKQENKRKRKGKMTIEESLSIIAGCVLFVTGTITLYIIISAYVDLFKEWKKSRSKD